MDDVYIYFRVVKNIINGNGPVINAGDRHIGITSPLWTFTLAFTALVFKSHDIIIVSKILYIIYLVLASCFLFLVLQPYMGDYSIFSPLPIFFNFSSQAFIGGETASVYFALTGFLYALLVKRNYLLTGIFMGLAYLARAELIFLLPIFLIYYVVKGRQEGETARSMVLKLILPLCTLLIVVLIWHAYYFIRFHSFFPSTLRVKMIQGRSGYLPLYYKKIWFQLNCRSLHNSCYLLFFSLFGIYSLGLVSLLLISFSILHNIAYTLLLVPGNYAWYYYDIHLITLLTTMFGVVAFFRYFKKYLNKYAFAIKTRNIADKSLSVCAILTFAAVTLLTTELYKRHLSLDYAMVFNNNYANFYPEERFPNYMKLTEWLNSKICKSDTVLTPEIGIISYFLERGFIRDVNGIASPDIAMGNMNNYEFFIERYSPEYIIYPWGKQPEFHIFRTKKGSYKYQKVFVVSEEAKEFNVSVFRLASKSDFSSSSKIKEERR